MHKKKYSILFFSLLPPSMIIVSIYIMTFLTTGNIWGEARIFTPIIPLVSLFVVDSIRILLAEKFDKNLMLKNALLAFFILMLVAYSNYTQFYKKFDSTKEIFILEKSRELKEAAKFLNDYSAKNYITEIYVPCPLAVEKDILSVIMHLSSHFRYFLLFGHSEAYNVLDNRYFFPKKVRIILANDKIEKFRNFTYAVLNNPRLIKKFPSASIYIYFQD